VEKYGTARQATDVNIIRSMRIACWITKATNTLRICNTYCFMATVVTRTRLSVVLYVHFLPLLPSHKQCISSRCRNQSPVHKWNLIKRLRIQQLTRIKMQTSGHSSVFFDILHELHSAKVVCAYSFLISKSTLKKDSIKVGVWTGAEEYACSPCCLHKKPERLHKFM
jgi:hypothetical protein